jgi:hypothetical protein
MGDVTPQPAAETEGGLGRKLLVVVLVGGVLVAAWVFVVSVLPRWWSHQVGDQVGGDLTTGGVVGFTYGFLATVLPLLVIAVVWRFGRRSAWAWLIGGALALLFAAPNLVTLGITIGQGSAAHAADRTLDVEAPWFRGGMVVGVAVALALAVFVWYVLASRSHARKRARDADEQLAAAASDGPRPQG